MIYLDDILCIEASVAECELNVKETMKLLESLGFLINRRKSSVIPSNRCKFLGFVIDSMKFAIELTQEKRIRLLRLVEEFSVKNRCSIREFAQLSGKLIAACLALEYGWVYTKILEREKMLALNRNNYQYNSKI